MGFSDETFAFLAGLEANNSRDWLEANRASYEAHWKDAALSFIADVSERMAALKPPLAAEPRLNGSLRRINRDVRFSSDKSPYNPRLHMIFWHGAHPNRSPAVHFVLDSSGIGYGAGQFGLEPAKLAAFRQRIVDRRDGDALIAALDEAEKIGCRMGEPELARLPQGFEAKGRRAELLRHKAIVARTFEQRADPSRIIGPAAADWVMGTSGAMMPLVRWLAA